MNLQNFKQLVYIFVSQNNTINTIYNPTSRQFNYIYFPPKHLDHTINFYILFIALYKILIIYKGEMRLLLLKIKIS